MAEESIISKRKGRKEGQIMAEMSLEYGLKGRAGMGKGGYNSGFCDKGA